MLRNILGVVLGYSLWTAIWLGGNALLFSKASDQITAEQGLTSVATLLGVLSLSIVCSLCAGFLVAKIAKVKRTPLMILAFLLLVTGIMVQTSIWDLMPVWYHLAFLLLLMPMTQLGARLGRTS